MLAPFLNASPAARRAALAVIVTAIPIMIAFLAGGPVTKSFTAHFIAAETATVATTLSISGIGAFGVIMAAAIIGMKQVTTIVQKYDVSFESDDNGDTIAILTKKK